MRIPSKYSEQGYKMQDFCPFQGKDWNEALCAGYNNAGAGNSGERFTLNKQRHKKENKTC